MKEVRRFRADPARTLVRLLGDLFRADVLLIQERPWASLTLDGRHHRLAVTSIGAPAFEKALPDYEFDIPGHFVASIAVSERHRWDDELVLLVDALTIRED